MTPRPPAQPGDPLAGIETPALVLDLDLFERNLARIAEDAARLGVRLRPHGKAHKCPVIARRQVAQGAVGICCQKVDEAEAFVREGISDVLLTNQVVHPAKLARLATLARDARIGLCVDDPLHVTRAGESAASQGVDLDIYIEIDVGQCRCGLPVGTGLVPLARQIAETPHLRFAGLHAYHGNAQHLRSPAEREAAIGAAADLVREAITLLKEAGIEVPLVTGAGTGTYELEAASGLWGEIQPGSYAFMDADYARNVAESPFDNALTLHATVLSTAVPGQAVLDFGLKAVAVDSGPPLPLSVVAEVLGVSDEHTILAQPEGAALSVGARVTLQPGHVDPTCNLHDWIVATRAGRVEELWPISARGAGL